MSNFNVKELKDKLNKIDTIFFDLDGTIIDTEPLYFRFWKEASKLNGYELSDSEALGMRSRDSNNATNYLKDLSDGILIYQKVKQDRIRLMNEYLKDHPIELKEGAIDFLNKLNKENKKLYIVTANAYEKANNILESLDLKKYFIDVISAKDVKRGKPFPDVYLKAAELINKEPKDVIVFEDSPNGLLSSYRAGCYTVMVEDMSEYTSEIDYVDAAIVSFKELL